MATIVLVGRPPIPVRYESWGAWRADVTRPLPPLPLVAPATASCALCWGQGRLWQEARNGEGLVSHECPHCAGSGLVLRGPARERHRSGPEPAAAPGF